MQLDNPVWFSLAETHEEFSIDIMELSSMIRSIARLADFLRLKTPRHAWTNMLNSQIISTLLDNSQTWVTVWF